VKYEPPAEQVKDEDLPLHLLKELQKLGDILNNLTVNSINVPLLAVEPEKVEEGLIVGADGTNWDPGSGAGLYQWRSGAWVKVG
jgi:hypothetical protein